MSNRVERKRLLMMKILRNSRTPLSSEKIQQQLHSQGMDISERTVRFHLQALDSLGLTGYREKKGRYLTPKGLKELTRAHVYDQVGFLSAKIDEITYKMTYSPVSSEGSVPVNLSLIDFERRGSVAALVPPVFASGLAHGNLIALFKEQEQVGDIVIPKGRIGLGTVCSITFNGALIQAGIPVSSVFGGLLEIRGGSPDRFTAVIRYDGTSLDPLEIFITSGMTSTGDAVGGGNGSGSGLIGASFREIPASAREAAVQTDARLKQRGLGGFLKLGFPGRPLLDIPVGDGRVGLIIPGGLNAVAPMVEQGIPIESRALCGLVDYSRLFPFGELPSRLEAL